MRKNPQGVFRRNRHLGEGSRAKVGGGLAAVDAEVLRTLEVALLRVRRSVRVHLFQAFLLAQTP